MKRILAIFISILLLAGTTTAFAQNRGALTNVWASWASVTSGTTFSPPSNSRDLWVHNGSAVDICVSLTGGTIQNNCYESVAAGEHSTMQLDGASDFYAPDFITNSITVRSATGAAASPVSVVVTY